MKLLFTLSVLLALVGTIDGKLQLRSSPDRRSLWGESIANIKLTAPEPTPKPTPKPVGKPSVCELEENAAIVDPPLTLMNRIYQIQGSDLTSSFVGSTAVRVPGIVTAVDQSSSGGVFLFYMQDLEGDGDDSTSDAIVVFVNNREFDDPPVEVGDIVSVTGTVSEFIPGGPSTRNQPTTQIDVRSGSVEIDSRGNALPKPVLIGQGGRQPPNKDMEEGVYFWESLEAMLVTVKAPLAIAPTNQFGEIFAVADQGYFASGLSDRGTLTISPNDFNPEKIQIDADPSVFDVFGQQDMAFPFVSTGAKLSDVIGVIGYNFGNYEIIPTEHFGLVDESTLEPTSASCKKDYNTMLVGTYNVLNLDPNDDDGDEDVANRRFEANAKIIVENMGAPDIVALQEVQDNDGSDTGDVSANETLQKLVDEIAKIPGAPKYEYVDNIFIGNNTSGGQPNANIRTAYLYNPWRVSFFPETLTTIGGQGDGEAFFDSRLPLVATFKFLPLQYKFDMVNVHFSSKGGSAAIAGVQQPFEDLQESADVNGGLDERLVQSAAVAGYVKAQRAGGKSSFIVLGDMNEFDFISPLNINLAGAALKNLADDIPQNERYSFIFQGNAQALDHIFVSADMCPGAVGEYVHVNAEFVYTDGRASDHDPMVACITLPYDD